MVRLIATPVKNHHKAPDPPSSAQLCTLAQKPAPWAVPSGGHLHVHKLHAHTDSLTHAYVCTAHITQAISSRGWGFGGFVLFWGSFVCGCPPPVSSSKASSCHHTAYNHSQQQMHRGTPAPGTRASATGNMLPANGCLLSRQSWETPLMPTPGVQSPPGAQHRDTEVGVRTPPHIPCLG